MNLMTKSTSLFLAFLAASPTASWGQEGCVNEIAGFDLVDAGENKIIGPLGDSFDYGALYARTFNFKAIPKACDGSAVKSVKFANPQGQMYCDQHVPFAVYGDKKGNYNSRILQLGTYNMTATPYTSRDCTGEAGASLTKTFSVTAGESTACPGVAGYFEMFNADTDKNLGPMKTGSLPMCTPDYNMNIKAAVFNCLAGSRTVSAKFNLSGSSIEDYESIDEGNKFLLYGGEVADVLGEKWVPGDYEISVTPFSRKNGRGQAGGSHSLKFGLKDCPKPAVLFCNGKTKPAVAQDSGFAAYPAVLSLNQYAAFDGYDTVTITASTATTTLAMPEIRFAIVPDDVTVSMVSAGIYTVTGPTAKAVEETLLSLEIRPGSGNGEDITVTVAAKGKVVDYDTSEALFDTLTTDDSCSIPVVPEVTSKFNLIASEEASGYEDKIFHVRTILKMDVDGSGEELEASEEYMLEIKASSLPTAAKLFLDRTLISADAAVHGYYRFTREQVRLVKLRGPPNFSGIIDLEARASVVVDPNLAGPVEVATPCKKTTIKLFPKADGIFPTQHHVGVTTTTEGGEPVAFGNTLALRGHNGISMRDRGQGAGNNPEPETLIKVEIQLPQDEEWIMSGTYVSETEGEINGSRTARVYFDKATRTYTITSNILNRAADLGAVSIEDRKLAELHIRNTLKYFSVAIGSGYDSTKAMEMRVTIADVNLGVADTRVNSFNPIKIIPNEM